jgi:hypothetical protein
MSFAAGACSGGDEEAAPAGNLFENPGFETGGEPWFSIVEETGFEVTSERAHTGGHAAVLRMDDPVSAEGNQVYYLVQDLEPENLPQVVDGFYRVENWNRGAERQYIQVAVIVVGPDNFPEDLPNYQLRYILAGQKTPPFEIRNAHFVFVNGDEPVEGEWVPFSLSIRDDFEAYWGMAPEDFESMRLLFEVRWDAKSAGSGAPRADVYYDDLYLGERRTD